MIRIGDELIHALRGGEYPVPVAVRDFYSPEPVKPPMLVRDESLSNDGVYLNGQPAVVTNIITLEAYAKARTLQGRAVSQRDLAMGILMEADRILNQQYGLTMRGQAVTAPYQDQGVCRAVARYIGYIDTRTNEILRGI